MAHAGTKTGLATQPRTFTLHILKGANGKFKVHPGTLIVEAGDKLEWQSIGTASTVMFPPVNGGEIVDRNRIPIAMGQKEYVVVLPVKHGMTNKFNEVEVPYAVHCVATNDFAEGGSDPKIIVKGP